MTRITLLTGHNTTKQLHKYTVISQRYSVAFIGSLLLIIFNNAVVRYCPILNAFSKTMIKTPLNNKIYKTKVIGFLFKRIKT